MVKSYSEVIGTVNFICKSDGTLMQKFIETKQKCWIIELTAQKNNMLSFCFQAEDRTLHTGVHNTLCSTCSHNMGHHQHGDVTSTAAKTSKVQILMCVDT
jgi:hypothetical protein